MLPGSIMKLKRQLGLPRRSARKWSRRLAPDAAMAALVRSPLAGRLYASTSGGSVSPWSRPPRRSRRAHSTASSARPSWSSACLRHASAHDVRQRGGKQLHCGARRLLRSNLIG